MESEVKSWLKGILKENLDDYSIGGLGNSEKGDNYLSDVLFVTLNPRDNKQGKTYELVLKCSKRSQELRATTPAKKIFMTEIYMYNKVMPVFTQFLLEKGITNPFSTFPKCYGTFITDDMENIVLENLKKSSYIMWDKTTPFTKQLLNLVVEEYAKFHSVSVVMKQHDPQKFTELNDGLGNIFKDFVKAHNMEAVYGRSILEIYDLLNGDLDDDTLDTWKILSEQAHFILNDMVDKENGLEVILHGSCWSNNFMFKYGTEETSPVDVSILDWQLSRASSPILDLSYFIFASISNKDLEYITDILNHYYEKLEFCLSRQGTNLEKLYSKKQFLDDWEKYAKYGVLLASLIYKLCSTTKDDVIDVGNVADDGKDLVEALAYEIKDKTAFKNKTRNIVKYVVENQLI